MENATKALLIAAGMLFAIMVISLLLMSWNSISNYFQSQNEQTKEVQLAEFNQQFENYANDDIRGSDLLSLINKIIDYNTRKTEVAGLGYEKMTITINIGNTSNFTYDGKVRVISSLLTQESNITETITETESAFGGTNGTSKISANISNFITQDSVTKKYTLNRENLEKYLTVDVSSYKDEELKELALKCYEITQFKRAHFECTGTTYDQDTGRIIAMKFKFTGDFE